MDTKFLIFVSVSAILIAAVYSSSVFIVFAAEGDTACIKSDHGTASCTVDNGDGTTTGIFCWKSGKTWKCDTVRPSTGGTTPDSALKNAIVKAKTGAAVGGATTGENNNTSVFNGGVVKGGAVFKGGAATEGNNTSTNSNNTLQ